jgi:hypothetical protein
MVAWFIRLGTLIFGSNELGVRSIGTVAAFGTILVLAAICRRLVGQDKAVAYLVVLWLCSPLLAVVGMIITPDSPSLFFSVCAMAFAVLVALRLERGKTDTARLWMGFGACTGLALLAKYTAILPAGAVVLALLTTPAGRRELKRPDIWLSAILALVIFFPVIQWNATHDWASFKYQLHHGMSESESAPTQTSWARGRFGSLGTFLAGQVGVFTPILFIFGTVVLCNFWVKYRKLSLARRILVWSATIPLVFFAFAAFKSATPGEANWPAFAYFPLSVLLIDHVAAAWKRSDVVWLQVGCALALVITVGLHLPDYLLKIPALRQPLAKKINEMYGWREMARFVDQQNTGDAMIVAGRHQDAAELSFYVRGQPDVWCYPVHDDKGNLLSRPTSFDYFPERPDLSNMDAVLYVQGHVDAFCKEYGYQVSPMRWNWLILLHGRPRDRSMVLCVRNLRTPPTTQPTSRPSGRKHRAATATTSATQSGR